MTKEQIDKLRVGDVIRAEYAVAAEDLSAFTLVSPNGTRHRATRTGHNPILDAAYLVTPEQATAPPSFEVGDTVRIAKDPWTGTAYGAGSTYNDSLGKTGRVVCSTKSNGCIAVCFGSYSGLVNIHCLELVKKAVKDKYAVRKCYVGGGWTSCKVVTLGHEYTVAEFICSLHPDAKAAAEAECERLNAEWHKQQEEE